MEVNEALAGGQCGVAKGGQFIRHVAVNDGPGRSGNLSPERPGVERGELSLRGYANITLRGAPRGVNVCTLSLRLPFGALI